RCPRICAVLRQHEEQDRAGMLPMVIAPTHPCAVVLSVCKTRKPSCASPAYTPPQRLRRLDRERQVPNSQAEMQCTMCAGWVFPTLTASDYHDGWVSRGGALELAFMERWTM